MDDGVDMNDLINRIVSILASMIDICNGTLPSELDDDDDDDALEKTDKLCCG
jgi:hypothetical protein